jgi:microcystin-dependent protein
MRSCAVLIVVVLGAAGAARADPLDPSSYAFSYQGEVVKNGQAPAGPCLVHFSLWDSPSSLTGKLGDAPDVSVPLDNGVFTVPVIDFGFDAEDRWLEIAVSCGDPGLTTLSPRQRVGSTGGVPPGTVVAFAGRILDVPQGWVLCDGRALPRAGLYARLFAAIGAANGSPDANNFNVPDYRGRFLRGVNNGTGRDPDVNSRTQPAGSSNGGGDAVGSLQDDELRSHTHSVAIHLQGGVGDHAINGAAAFKASDSTGAAGGSETRPTNVYVNYIIKY